MCHTYYYQFSDFSLSKNIWKRKKKTRLKSDSPRKMIEKSNSTLLLGIQYKGEFSKIRLWLNN